MATKYYQFYPTILFTKGYNRTLVLDLLRAKTDFIPNEIYSIVQTNQKFTKRDIDLEWFNLFLENDMIFEVEKWEEGYFPKLSLAHFEPKKIAHCIMKLSNHNIDKLKNISSFAKDCHFYFIIEEVDLKWDTFFSILQEHESDTVEFGAQNMLVFKNRDFNHGLASLKKIICIDILEEVTIQEELTQKKNKGLIVFRKKNNYPLNISISLKHYTEAQKHHTYFNKKIFIDKKGFILRYFDDEKIFGQIAQINEKEINSIHKKINSLWEIPKNKTDVCQVCEFRYICVDRRIPLKRSMNKWYHSEECAYNPFISKMVDEPNYKTLIQIGVYSNSHHYRINHKRISKFNSEIWD